MPFLHDFNKANQSLERFLGFINGLTREGSKIVVIEKSDNTVLQLFDKYSGIDAIQITKDKQLRGIAIRVQYGIAWDTFTIRYKRTSGAKTEYEKRVDAIKNNKFYPHLTLQCYLSLCGEEVLSVGIIRTVDLYDQLIMEQTRKAGEDGNEFLFIGFKQLNKILVYKKEIGKPIFYQDKEVA